MSDILDKNLEKLMKRADKGGDPQAGADNKVFADVMKKLKSERAPAQTPKRRPGKPLILGVAGALAAAAAILIAALTGSGPEVPGDDPGRDIVSVDTQSTIATPSPRPLELTADGAPVTRDLDDGSTITLSPGSKVTVTAMAGRPRPRIQLERGEVTCEVAKGRGMFRVITPVGEATALGTTYKVLLEEKPQASRKRVSRRADLAMTVTVTSGEVFVNSNTGEGQIARAGQAVTIVKTSGPVEDWSVAQLVPKLEDGSQGEPLEVRSHDVKVTIRDQVALIEVDQVFFNPTGARMEGTFYFPLPSGASICRLAMYVGDNLMEGEIAEAVRARRTFEALKVQRIDPALLEWAGGNNFKMRVFPIEPESEKRVLISYYQVLERENGTVRFRYPLATDALQTHPVGKISVEANIYSGEAISETRAPGLPAQIAPGPQHAKVTHNSQKATPAQDFTLEYDLPGRGPELVAMPYWHEKGDDGYFLLALSPELEEFVSSREQPDRFIFVMEKSGPLGQKYLNLASKAVRHGIKMLDANDEFAVVAYDTFAEQFGAGFVPADDDNVARACEWVGHREAEGASDLTVAWDAVSRLAGDNKTLVIYVGSGTSALTSTRPGPLLREAGAALSDRDVSIHCLAIGAIRNDDFLAELARRYSGSLREIASAADVFARIPDLIADVGRPLYRNVSIEFEGVEVSDIYPEKLSNVAAGRQLFIYGRYLEQGTATLRVTATHPDGAYDKKFEIDFGANAANTCIAPMWASRKIEHLQLKAGSSSSTRADPLRREVIETSKRYTVMSQYTSFIVLETPEDYARYGIERRVREFGPYAGQGPAASAQLMSLARARSPQMESLKKSVKKSLTESFSAATSDGKREARVASARKGQKSNAGDVDAFRGGRIADSAPAPVSPAADALPAKMRRPLVKAGLERLSRERTVVRRAAGEGAFAYGRIGDGFVREMAEKKSDKISWSRANIFPEVGRSPADPYANLPRNFRRSPADAMGVIRKLASRARTLSCTVTRYSLDSEGSEKKQGRAWNVVLDVPAGRYVSHRDGDDSIEVCDGKRLTRLYQQLKYCATRAAIKRDVLSMAHTLPGMLMNWPEKLDREYTISIVARVKEGLVLSLTSRRDKHTRTVIHVASPAGPITKIERYVRRYQRSSSGRYGYVSVLDSTTLCEDVVEIGDSKIATTFRIVRNNKTEVVRLSKLVANKDIPLDAYSVEIPEDWSVRDFDVVPGSGDRSPISRPVNPSPNSNPWGRRIR